MNLEIRINKGKKIALLNEAEPIINELQDALDLLGNASYLEAEGIIIHAYNLHPDFFDLSTGFAGEILQKFSNYSMKLMIVGDFKQYKSRSLKDFIHESNKQGNIGFVMSPDEAFAKLE